MMLPTEITELIKKKAEEYASQIICKPEEMWDFDDQRKWEREFNAFFSGQTEGIELMIGFTEWMAKYCSPDFYGDDSQDSETTWGTTNPKLDKNISYKTIELLVFYIKEVLSK